MTPTHDIGSLMPLLDYYLEQQQIREAEEEDGEQKETSPRPVWKCHPLSLVGQGRAKQSTSGLTAAVAVPRATLMAQLDLIVPR